MYSIYIYTDLSYIYISTVVSAYNKRNGLCKLTVPLCLLFTIARTWKQPRCPSTDEWIKKLWYIYIKEYYSAIKGLHLSQF